MLFESTQTLNMWLAALVMAATYVFIFTELIHRTSAAIIGAVVMIAVGNWAGFYSQESAIMALDGNTLLLLAGMMIVVAMLRPTGGFEYIAIRLAKLSAGHPRRLLLYLTLTVSLISTLLDNVTTVLIFAPLTVLITRILSINPMPYLMAEAMLSNIGGAATLVGDPPNLMIGSAGDIPFTTFLWHMGPMVLIVWSVTFAMLLILFHGELGKRIGDGRIIDLDEQRAITDPVGLRQALFALLVIVVLFFLHHRMQLYPAYVAFIGVAIALGLMGRKPDPILGKLEWSVLVFFAGLFIIVGGVEASGLLELIGQSLVEEAMSPDRLLITCLLLMWIAALLSAVVDNIPFTVTMIPIITSLESHGINVAPFWWALAIGVGIGGNGTHIGATANIICIAESERSGIPEARITPAGWLRSGLPSMLGGLIFASLVYGLFFDFFATPL